MIYRAKRFKFVVRKWSDEGNGNMEVVGVREVMIDLTPEQEEQIGDLHGGINTPDFSQHVTIEYHSKP